MLKTEMISPEILRRIPLLRNMNESEFRQMTEVVRVREFSPGEVVIEQGGQSRNLWVVLEGQCQVVRRLKPAVDGEPEGDTLVLASLKPFNHFGEMSFFHAAPHSADVRASSAVKLLQITHGDYHDMVREGIGAAFKLAYNVVQELAERLRRMDEWVADLATNSAAAANVPEFSRFRNKMLDGWSL